MLSIYNFFEVSKNQHMSRSNIKIGSKVCIVLKKDQKTSRLTCGIIKKILTSKRRHTRGIKVMLKDGSVGRVQKILR